MGSDFDTDPGMEPSPAAALSDCLNAALSPSLPPSERYLALADLAASLTRASESDGVESVALAGVSARAAPMLFTHADTLSSPRHIALAVDILRSCTPAARDAALKCAEAKPRPPGRTACLSVAALAAAAVGMDGGGKARWGIVAVRALAAGDIRGGLGKEAIEAVAEAVKLEDGVCGALIEFAEGSVRKGFGKWGRGKADVAAALEVLAGTGENGVEFGRFVDVFVGASLAGVDVRGGPRLRTPFGEGEEKVLFGKIEAGLGRGLRRERAAALRAVPKVVQACGANFDALMESEVGKGLVEATQSGDEGARDLGVEALRAIAERGTDISVFSALAERLGKCLRTAKYAYQRIAAAATVVAVCQGVDGDCGGVAVIVQWVSSKKETGEDARASAVFALVDALIAQGEGSDDVGCALLADVLAVGGRRPGGDNERKAAVAHLLRKSLNLDDSQKSISEKRRVAHVLANASIAKALHGVAEDSKSSTSNGDDALRASALLLYLQKGNGEFATSSLQRAVKAAASTAAGKGKSGCVVENEVDALALATAAGCLLLREFTDDDKYASALVRLAADRRPGVARVALNVVREARSKCGAQSGSILLLALWNVELSDSPSAIGACYGYSFDDGGAERRRLSLSLLACIGNEVSASDAGLALLASHHPRVCPVADIRSRVVPTPSGACWPSVRAALPQWEAAVDEGVVGADETGVSGVANKGVEGRSDGMWLESALEWAVGPCGLSAPCPDGIPVFRHPLVLAASSAVAGLISSAESGSEARELFDKVLQALRGCTGLAPALSREHWASVEKVRSVDAERALSKTTSSSSTTSKSKKTVQAKVKAPQAGSAAAAAAEKLAVARVLAAEADIAVLRTSAGLQAIQSMCMAAPKTAQSKCPVLLSLVLPSTRFPILEQSCRGALLSLAESFDRPVQIMALDIATTLYRLSASSGSTAGVDTAVFSEVARLVHWLKKVCDPPLSAEGFALIAPLVKEAMTRPPPAAKASGRMNDERAAAAAAKKEAIGVTRASAEVLCAHCAPGAIDAAVAAAAARAGNWALVVLEREDAAFGIAADALSSLAGTALNPGSSLLSQVLGGVVSGKSSVREAALTALERLPALSQSSVVCPRDPVLGRTLWLGLHDPEEENAMIAKDLWEQYRHPLQVSEDTVAMLALLAHVEFDVRVMAGRSIAEALVGEDHSKVRSSVIPQMFSLYLKKLPASVGGLAQPNGSADPSIPKQRRDVGEDADADEGWPGRHGVALALRDMADCNALTEKDIPIVFAFLSSRGLGDLHDDVRTQMSAAAMAVVSQAGAELGPLVLLPMIEKQLNSSSSVESGATKEAIAHADRTRENLVMCLGGVAGHLPAGDPRKEKTAEQVIKTAMETPSEAVQNAAARCLVPLAPAAIQGGKAKDLRDRLVNKLWDKQASYGERRGAAYALAGLVRGLGIKSMKEFGLVEELENAAEDKTDPRRRQGAFLAMETMAIMLGRLYEPYTVRALPILLVSMGDNVVEVRNACWTAAQASMAEVSSQGVKMILPSLLSGLNDRQWRTKAGSAEVLGAMAFCAPRQLSLCLPQVVPKLADALADAHPKVVASAESAIGRIAAVVRSPEVRGLSKFLLAALRDPTGRTAGALDAMLGTEFIHAIDPASLALLIPPLHRGLRDRSTDLKKRAAAIVGSMCNNVSDVQDVAPYLDMLLPDLRVTLLDAIPDVRKTSARAIGALATALGEVGMPGIVPWLMATLVSGGVGGGDMASNVPAGYTRVVVSSSAERAGAALGLAEFCSALEDNRIEDVLKRVLEAGRRSPEAREGGLMLLAAMPLALGDRYEGRLGMALISILQGLSDDSDNVREAALDAGRKTVTTYAKTSLETLLPELLKAMRDVRWRIRQAATQLLGDFLLVIAGAIKPGGQVDGAGNDDELINSDEDGSEGGGSEGSADVDSDGEEITSPEEMMAAMSLEATMKAIEEVLGYDRRNEVLAALYIIRCDVSIRVRQMGMQVWKTVVSNTPRVLREIMPSAVGQVVVALSDEDEERRAAAGKCLGDLAQKLGDRVVPEVLPSLQAGITDKNVSDRVRLGACDGLFELVQACPKGQLIAHAPELLAAVRDALCDHTTAVRSSGAEVFALLLRPLGSTAVDDVIPMLVKNMSTAPAAESGDDDGSSAIDQGATAERALDSMKLCMGACGNRLLSIVVPRLLEEHPLTVETCRALTAAATAAEEQFEDYIDDVVDVIIKAADSGTEGAIPLADIIDPVADLIAAIASGGDEVTVSMLEKVYLAFNEVSVSRRLAAGALCGAFCRSADEDSVVSRAVSLFEVLIRQLSDGDDTVVVSAWQALVDLTTSVPCSRLTPHVGHIRQALRSTAAGVRVGDPDAMIAGLNIPKGPMPFVPIFIEALLHGSPTAREQAALSIADMTEMTNAKILSPFVIKLTGPLIRVASERFPWQVKAAILRAMLRLLEKAAPLLRTFAPQLQSTFVKSLADPNRLVRVRGCAALGALVPVQPRVEALLNELLSLGENGAHEGARTAAYLGAARVFKSAKKLPPSAFESMPLALLSGLEDEGKSAGKSAARALGVLATRCASADQYAELLSLVTSRLTSDETDFEEKAQVLLAVGYMSRAGAVVAGQNGSEFGWHHIEPTTAAISSALRSSVPPVQTAASAAAVDVYILLESAAQLKSPSAAYRRAVMAQLGMMAEMDDSVEVRVGVLHAVKKIVSKRSEVLVSLAPALVACAGTSNTAIRNVADRVLRRAFVVQGMGTVDTKNVAAVKSELSKADQDFIDRRLAKVIELPDSDVEEDLNTADE